MKQTADKPASARQRGVVDPRRILAREVMVTDVLVLETEDHIKEAAERLEELHISGAPVVDAAGHLVGVLTLSDIARSEHVSDSGVSTRIESRSGETLEGMIDELGEDEELFPTEDYDTQVLGGLRLAHLDHTR